VFGGFDSCHVTTSWSSTGNGMLAFPAQPIQQKGWRVNSILQFMCLKCRSSLRVSCCTQSHRYNRALWRQTPTRLRN